MRLSALPAPRPAPAQAAIPLEHQPCQASFQPEPPLASFAFCGTLKIKMEITRSPGGLSIRLHRSTLPVRVGLETAHSGQMGQLRRKHLLMGVDVC